MSKSENDYQLHKALQNHKKYVKIEIPEWIEYTLETKCANNLHIK